MLVRDDLALHFRRREMRVLGGVAAEPVLDPVLHHGVGQDLCTVSSPELLIGGAIEAASEKARCTRGK